ncbi:uncharacterized protein LOC130752790 [Actinidia eriantha]|uniref:uncharacterized protein LOC130752790 n=1 Tax=Actinidia eriantha TaxID=165200 RepID=UPI002585EF81|nr:uncharacterized protein LOC130752790 [Actinidia eriantha]
MFFNFFGSVKGIAYCETLIIKSINTMIHSIIVALISGAALIIAAAVTASSSKASDRNKKVESLERRVNRIETLQSLDRRMERIDERLKKWMDGMDMEVKFKGC